MLVLSILYLSIRPSTKLTIYCIIYLKSKDILVLSNLETHKFYLCTEDGISV